jgi:hypothetical protein
MKSKLILGLALVLSSGLVGYCSIVHADGQAYQNTHYGFQLVAPEGWAVTETNFSHSHYADVFLTINSQRPNLAIQNQNFGGGFGGFGPKTTFEQMRPGEAYVSVGYFDGPGGPTMESDCLTNDLLPLLTTNHISVSSEPGLSELGLRFFKRGHWWSLSVYMREPVMEANRRKVMALLASFRFLDAPVSNVAWAESLAWKKLPENIRAPERWPVWPVVDYAGQRPQSGPRSVLVEKIDSGYSVKFTVDGVGAWEYRVSASGKVLQSKQEKNKP